MSLPAAMRLACLMSLTASLPQNVHSAGEAPSGDAGLARCAAITQPSPRLACFDALAAASAHRDDSLLAAAPTAPAPAPAPAPGDPRTFGLSPAQLQPVSSAPSSIKAHVATIAGQVGTRRAAIALDNGQSWEFSEPLDDPRLVPGATVTIKRAVLGSFLLTTPSQQTYHVHRIR
jgi:hypothetical protein